MAAMGMCQILVLFIVGFTLSDAAREDLLLSLACPGEADCGHHLLDCEPYDGVIRVKGAIHGYKAPEAQAHCHALARDLCLVDRDPCCTFSNTSDCLQLVPRSDLKLLHGTCGGKGQCLFRSQHMKPGPCTSIPDYSPFSAVAYACVNRSLLLNPATSEPPVIVGREVHIFYPGRRQLTQRPSVLQEDDDPRQQGPPTPTPDSSMVIRSALTTLSQFLQAEKFRLNQVFGSQGNDQDLLNILEAMMDQQNEEEEGEEEEQNTEEEDGDRILNSEGVQNNDGRDADVGREDTVIPEVTPGTDAPEVTPWMLDRLQDVRLSLTGAIRADVLNNFGDLLAEQNEFVSTRSQADVLNDFSNFAKQNETPMGTFILNRTYPQPGENPNAEIDHSVKNLDVAMGRSTPNLDVTGSSSALKVDAATDPFVEHPDAVLDFSLQKLDAVTNQCTQKLYADKDPTTEKKDAILHQSGEKPPADIGRSTRNPDAVIEHAGELFYPGEGYSCRVTGSGNGVSEENGWQEKEEEVAVSVVYLRLVGTRGCTDIHVSDGTRGTQQRATFRCTQNKVTKMAGRQLKTMVTPVTTRLRLSSSIWEDDFIWIKFTSVTGGPLTLQCQQTINTTSQSVDDKEADWLVVISGLAVTGFLFLVFAVIAVVYFFHRKRSFTGSGEFEMKQREKEKQQRTSDSNDHQASAEELEAGVQQQQPRPISATDISNNSFYALSETFCPAAASSSLSLSQSRLGHSENSSLPPLPPLPAVPGANPRRSTPAMPTRPAPTLHWKRHVPSISSASSTSFAPCASAAAAVAIETAASGPRDHQMPSRVAHTRQEFGEERRPHVNAKGWRQVLPPLEIYRNVRNLVTRGSAKSTAGARTRRSRGEENSAQPGVVTAAVVPLDRGREATWQAVDRHSQVQGTTWQTCYDRPATTTAATACSGPSLSVARPALGLSRFYAAFSAFQQQQQQRRAATAITTTDLDAKSESGAEMKSDPAYVENAPCTATVGGEDDGESVDSSTFDFDSFATGDLSDKE